MNTIFKGFLFMFILFVFSGCGDGDSADGRTAATGEWAQEQAEEARSGPVPVEALEVSRGSVLQSIAGSGTVRGETEVTVISEAQGRIEEADFELGEFVEAGAPLVRVDDTVARLNVEEAQGMYESARLDLEATQRRFDAGSASQADLTRARSAANGARARLETARKTLEDQTVRAPVSGFIASRGSNISRGNFLDRGVPIARIVDLSVLRVEIGLGERELQFLDPGAEARVWVAACSAEPYRAQVFSVAAGADDRTGSFPVVVRWENTCDRVRSGMNARVEITPGESSWVVIAPGSAIRHDSRGAYVFVAESGDDGTHAVRREIVTGDRIGDRVEVLRGLGEGDIVVTSGLSTLEAGQALETTLSEVPGDAL